MSGRKHHHIPQFFLRNFSFEGGGTNRKIIVHHRDRGIYTPSIDGVAAIRDFYSEPDNTNKTLDDTITVYENRIIKLLSEIQNLPETKNCNADIAAEIVTHLMIRAAYIRTSVSEFFSKLIDHIDNNIEQYIDLYKFLELHKPKPGKRLKDILLKQYNSMPNHNKTLPFSIFVDICYPKIQQSILSDNSENHNILVKQYLTLLRDERKHAMRSSHNKSLEKSLVPESRLKKLRKLHWHVQFTEDNALILPDCIAIGQYSGNRTKPLLFGASGELLSVQMPIAHNRLLVGSRFDRVHPNINQLNKYLASCSWEEFYSRQGSSSFSSLILSIGKEIKKDMNEVVESAKVKRYIA